MIVRDFLCSHTIHLLTGDDTVRSAASAFSAKKIDAAPVVDENQRLIGLFAKNHILKLK